MIETLYSCVYFLNTFLKNYIQKSKFRLKKKIPKTLLIDFGDLFLQNSLLLVIELTGWNLTLQSTEWKLNGL